MPPCSGRTMAETPGNGNNVQTDDEALWRVGVLCTREDPILRERAALRPDSLRASRLAFEVARRPPPDFSPPPDCLFTVCHARLTAVFLGTPRFSKLFSMCSACRFCLLVYLDFEPLGIRSFVQVSYRMQESDSKPATPNDLPYF